MKKTFSIIKAFGSGFELLGKNIGVFAAVFGILFCVEIVFRGIDLGLGILSLIPYAAILVLPVRFIVDIVFLAVWLLLFAGLVKVLLQVVDGKKLEVAAAVKELFINYKYLGNQVLAALILWFSFVGLGLVFFAVLALTLLAPYLTHNSLSWSGLTGFIPGLLGNPWTIAEFVGILMVFLAVYSYLFTRIYFFMYLLVDRNLGPVESIKKSFEITYGNFWKLVGFNLVLLAVVFLGFLCCFIGIFAAIPICYAAQAHVYRKLSANT